MDFILHGRMPSKHSTRVCVVAVSRQHWIYCLLSRCRIAFLAVFVTNVRAQRIPVIDEIEMGHRLCTGVLTDNIFKQTNESTYVAATKTCKVFELD